jgi:hypothetical protein
MSQAIGFASRSISREGENCALPDEVRSGVVLVELRKNRASASRDRNSWDGFGSFASIYTTKWVSMVKRDI